MTKSLNKTNIFVMVAILFIGAAVFLSAPFTEKESESFDYNMGYTNNAAAQGNAVTINDEGVALGILGESKTGQINWTVIGITTTAVCLIGAVTVIFLTHE